MTKNGKLNQYMTKQNKQGNYHYQRRTPASILKLESLKIPKELYINIGTDKKDYKELAEKVEYADHFAKCEYLNQKVRQQIVEDLLGVAEEKIDDLYAYAIKEGFDKGEDYNEKTLSALGKEMYLKMKTDEATDETIEQNKRQVEVLVEIFGDVHIEELENKDFTKLKLILNNLPPRLTAEQRALSLSDWIKIAEDNLKEKDPKKKITKTLSPRTKNHYLSALKNLMNFYKTDVKSDYSVPKFDYYDEGLSSKKAFSKQEIRILAKTTPDYECSKWISKNDLTNGLMKDIIGLYYYTGMRLTEMKYAEIVEINGILCIDLSYDNVVDKQKGRLKTKNSYRTIPLHSDALAHFENIKKYVNSYDIKSLSNKFKAHISCMGFDERYTFHSLRHTFASTLGNNNVPLEVMKLLMGHKMSITEEYGKEKELLLMKEMIERIPNVLANENREYLK